MRIICIAIAAMAIGCADEYQKAGEKYQCFAGGDQVYKSNVRPEYRGGEWWRDQITGSKFIADDCFCMGCIGF